MHGHLNSSIDMMDTVYTRCHGTYDTEGDRPIVYIDMALIMLTVMAAVHSWNSLLGAALVQSATVKVIVATGMILEPWTRTKEFPHLSSIAIIIGKLTIVHVT